MAAEHALLPRAQNLYVAPGSPDQLQIWLTFVLGQRLGRGVFLVPTSPHQDCEQQPHGATGWFRDPNGLDRVYV